MTTGQTTRSLKNHRPHWRRSRIAASTKQAMPAATSQVSRRLSSRATNGRSGPSAGIITQATPYTGIPTPPSARLATNPIRISSGSIPSRRANATQTPATTPSAG